MWRHVLQWQMWAFIGRLDLGMVVEWTWVLQRQDAVNVIALSLMLLGGLLWVRRLSWMFRVVISSELRAAGQTGVY